MPITETKKSQQMQEKIIDQKRQGEALKQAKVSDNNRKMYIESYGCQMNFSDSEIIASILTKRRVFHYTEY